MLKTNLIIITSITSLIVIFFFFSFKAQGNQEYNACLKNSYDAYKRVFLSKDGRIIDPDKNNITTSEGQSYMLIRSVIMGDKRTFNLVYKWSQNNLQRKDKLFAWLWGKNKAGEYKILDYNSASDADLDIAFALLLAYERWGNYKYLEEAKPIINSIWNYETRRIGDHLILMPGVNQTTSDKIEVNPSYFAPYAFKFFQKYDELHDWNCLVISSYYYLNEVMAKTQTGLPPNWFLIKNGQIVLEDSPRSDFSYDAIRVFQRTNLDYLRTGDKRALPILDKSKFFVNKWNESGTLYVNYKANGELKDKDKFIGSIAILVPAISTYDASTAFDIYKKEVEPYLQNEKYWQAKHDYYGKNLLWFGCFYYYKDSKEYKDMHKRRLINY